MEKNLPPNAGDAGSIPGLGRSPGEGKGYLFQYSCLENFIDRGSWQATVHGDVELDSTEWLTYVCVRNYRIKNFSLLIKSEISTTICFPCSLAWIKQTHMHTTTNKTHRLPWRSQCSHVKTLGSNEMGVEKSQGHLLPGTIGVSSKLQDYSWLWNNWWIRNIDPPRCWKKEKSSNLVSPPYLKFRFNQPSII